MTIDDCINILVKCRGGYGGVAIKFGQPFINVRCESRVRPATKQIMPS